ncbi:MAG TPA: prenyltransferase [bacterium]|nr:prenyltransferase [bacterium]
MTKPSNRFGIWITATRPFAYSASVSAVLLGAALAYYEGYPPQWVRFFLTLTGVLAFHTAANLLNDRVDFDRGVDRDVQPTSGAVVRGWLTPDQAARAAAGILMFGIGIGLVLTRMAGLPILFLGLAGTLLVLFYTRAGFCLKYAALGDPTVFVAFGVLPVLGTYFVQAGRFGIRPFLWTLPLVSYTVGILHANNWRDRESDPECGCRTLASVLGDRRSAVYYRLLVLGPFVLVLLYFLLGRTTFPSLRSPVTVLAVLSVLPSALKRARIDRLSDPDSFLMLDGLTARMQLLFGLLLSLAFFLGRYVG